MNRQIHQNHSVRPRANHNRTPYYIRDNRYNNINDSYPRTPQYRHYTHSNTHFLLPIPLHRTYLPNITDFYLQTPHYRSYLPRDTKFERGTPCMMHRNIENDGHQNVNRRVRCYNCGEFNNQQSTCTLIYKLRCELCHALRH